MHSSDYALDSIDLSMSITILNGLHYTNTVPSVHAQGMIYARLNTPL